MFSILALVGTLLGISNVNAKTYNGNIKSNGYLAEKYYYIHKEGDHLLWDRIRELVRSSDGDRVYCIQPFAKINEDATYEVATEDVEQIIGLKEPQWKLISKIAYYGWNYKDANHDHSADKWYVATQMLLWKIVSPNIESYFTTTLKGERDDSILKNEMDEILNLVNNHELTPNFVNIPKEIMINQSVTITDINGVLNGYELSNVKGGIVSKNENNLNIRATELGKISFSLQKLGNVYSEPIKVYYAVDNQNALHKGNIDPIIVNFNISVKGADVTINKTDDETYEQKPQGDASLKDALYGVYKEDGTKVGTLITDENGNAKSKDILPLGKYYVLEEKPSLGYELDKNKYFFEVTKNNLHPTIQVFEKVIKRTFDLTKVFANPNTGIMTAEPYIKFGFYNSQNKLIKELTTDKQGNITINLPYGSYKVKQLTTTDGFEKAKDFILEVKSSGESIKMVVSNAEITARLKVIKVDSETGNVVKKSNIKFKILDVKTGKYVKQTITYPKAQTIDVFETDDNGILITPYPLNSGTYRLEEVDQPINGYLWNSKSIEFTINGSSKFIEDDEYGIIFETKFSNTPVKGKVLLHKVGESIEFEEKGYKYNYVDLSNIKFGLFAKENIYDSTGILKYKKNSLISIGYTNDKGNIEFKNLYLGKYYVKELETKNNYALDNNMYEFELTYKDQYTKEIDYKLEIKNQLKKSDLIFIKSDISTGKPIANTKIEIYTENNNLVFSGITDKDGKISITNLFVGKFYIIETEASTGYKLSNEKVYFEITENGEVIKASMTNKKVTSTLEFTKVDLSTGEPLPNTKIQIFNEKDELVYEGLTDENGKIIIDEIEYGKYYIIESEAPEGYNINPEKMYFEVTKDGEIIKATMSDEKTIIDVPITELNDYSYGIGVLFLSLGIGSAIYVISKKKKN